MSDRLYLVASWHRQTAFNEQQASGLKVKFSKSFHFWLTRKKGTQFFVGEIDEELSANGYILPGIGDIGDRLYNTG